MQDFVELRLFPKDSLEFASVNHPVLGLVSAPTEGKSIEQVLAIHREILIAGTRRWPGTMVYGEGDDPGYVMFQAERKDWSNLESFLLTNAGLVHSPGIIIGNGKQGYYVTVHPRTTTVLPPWNDTAERLDEWFQNVRPGFKGQGYFPRSVVYVESKLRQHGV